VKVTGKKIGKMETNQMIEESATEYSSQLPKVIPMRQMDSMDKTRSMEELRPPHSSYFPEELPMRPGPPPTEEVPWKQHLRGFWTFSLSSYSLIHTPDGAARLRHLAMVTILLLRTGMSALSIISVVIKWNVPGIVIYSLLAILTFWFTATCLAIIGDAEGDKQLKGFVIVSHIHYLFRLRSSLCFRPGTMLTTISARNDRISISFSASV
jgi:hypothetical protein